MSSVARTRAGLVLMIVGGLLFVANWVQLTGDVSGSIRYFGIEWPQFCGILYTACILVIGASLFVMEASVKYRNLGGWRADESRHFMWQAINLVGALAFGGGAAISFSMGFVTAGLLSTVVALPFVVAFIWRYRRWQRRYPRSASDDPDDG